MSLGDEILGILKTIRDDIQAYAENKKYLLIAYDTEPDVIPRFPALAYYVASIAQTPTGLSFGHSYEFSANIIYYNKLPLSAEPAQPDAAVSDLINYFVSKGYEIASVSMEDISLGSALLRRAEISIKLSKFIK